MHGDFVDSLTMLAVRLSSEIYEISVNQNIGNVSHHPRTPQVFFVSVTPRRLVTFCFYALHKYSYLLIYISHFVLQLVRPFDHYDDAVDPQRPQYSWWSLSLIHTADADAGGVYTIRN